MRAITSSSTSESSTSSGGIGVSHDARGNTNAIGANGYTYDSLNRLTYASPGGGTSLYYDPLGNLFGLYSHGSQTMEYWLNVEGRLIGEYDPWGGVLRRYVHGPGMDEPLVWYEGAGLTDRRWLHADERGSIVATSDASGAALAIRAHGEFGEPYPGSPPGGSVFGRFGYTGQAWIEDARLYHYKARAYNPSLGRFMQTDPLGYVDGANLYAYVLNDPVNFTDPWGLEAYCYMHNNMDGYTFTFRDRDGNEGIGAVANSYFFRCIDLEHIVSG